jgi:hypothetical protein
MSACSQYIVQQFKTSGWLEAVGQKETPDTARQDINLEGRVFPESSHARFQANA